MKSSIAPSILKLPRAMGNTPGTPDNMWVPIDTPDPDNLIMILMKYLLYPDTKLAVSITGRPLNVQASTDTPLYDWSVDSAMKAQKMSALRLQNFLRHFGIKFFDIYDGGIAPRTPVPHHIHLKDYYNRADNDPVYALEMGVLRPQEELVSLLNSRKEWTVAVGGPMTGIHQVLLRDPTIARRITELHAMYGTWGTVPLMSFNGLPRKDQFNLTCDPVAGHTILNGLSCPQYLYTSEVTRVGALGFHDHNELARKILSSPRTSGAKEIYNLYKWWYEGAVKGRQVKFPDEKLFIHDVAPMIGVSQVLRDRIYNMVPVVIDRVPHLPSESESWGQLRMKPKPWYHFGKGYHYAADAIVPGGDKLYLKILKEACKIQY